VTLRFLVVAVILVASVCGQSGMFHPATVHLKAGDLASEIASPKILHAGGASAWSSANLTGRLTVLTFFPDTSHNLQSVPAGMPWWNNLQTNQLSLCG
jgi:hypothetical protein